MKAKGKSSSAGNKNPSSKEKLLKKPKKDKVSSGEYEENLRKSKRKTGIPCAF